MENKASIISFVFSSVFLAYLWGVITGMYQIFPYAVFKNAQQVLDEFTASDSDTTPASKSQGP